MAYFESGKICFSNNAVSCLIQGIIKAGILQRQWMTILMELSSQKWLRGESSGNTDVSLLFICNRTGIATEKTEISAMKLSVLLLVQVLVGICAGFQQGESQWLKT